MTGGRALTLSAAWLQLCGAPFAEQNPAFIPQRRLLSVSEHLFPGWSWRPSQTHVEVTDQSFVLQDEAKLSHPCPDLGPIPQQGYWSLGDLFSQRITGESGDEETQKPKSKSLCIEEKSSCTWQSATKSEQAVMENGCVYRKSTSHPLAKAATLITGSQRIKFGSSYGACHAREVIKTELKWFHNSNWKQEWGKC